MAAEVPVCDVLCEAMEYLSKLGSNLRIRSENLKDKRIRKDKLRNAHAVHKAAKKVLLICELSKKSLENVETGVRKVLATVDASQAPSYNGGKTIDKRNQQNKQNVYYFDYESHKLRISKRISLKHYMSVKVVAKCMPTSMQNKYPVFYDCKLKEQRERELERKLKSEGKFEKSLRRKSSSYHSDTNKDNVKTCDNMEDLEVNEADLNEGGSSNKDRESRSKTIDHDKSNSDRRKPQVTEDLMSKTNDGSYTVSPRNSQINLDINEQSNLSEKTELEIEENKKEKNLEKHLPDPDVIECYEAEKDKQNSVKNSVSEDNLSKNEGKNKTNKILKDSRYNREKHRKREKEAKLSRIKVFTDSSESDESSCKNKFGKISEEKNLCSCDEENKFNTIKNNSGSEPKTKKAKFEDKDEDSKRKDDDEPKTESKNIESDQKEVGDEPKPLIRCVNITKDDDEPKTESKNIESDQKEVGDEPKPLIRCVNITKLLKPDILDSKINEFSKGEQPIRNKLSVDKSNSANDNKIRKNKDKNAIEQKSDEEYWALKRREVKQFKPKKFTVTIERLPQLSTTFLLTHNLKKITQGCDIICEALKENDRGLKHLQKNVNKVKNALLNDSESDSSESAVAVKANKVKKTLLNDSDSDRELNTESSEQTSREKVMDPTAIKDALLNDSDSDKNGEQIEKDESVICDSDANNSLKELEQRITEKIKSALLNDSDSDNNQDKTDDMEKLPTQVENNNDEIEDETIVKGKEDNSSTQNNEEDSSWNIHTNMNEQQQSTQDAEKINNSTQNNNEDSSCNVHTNTNEQQESSRDAEKINNLPQNNTEDSSCNVHTNTNEQEVSTQDAEKIKSSLLNDSSDQSESSVNKKSRKIKMLKHARKRSTRSMQAKKMLLNYSSSSENENDHSHESDKNSRKRKKGRRKSSISSSSSSEKTNKKKKINSRDSTSPVKSKDGHSDQEKSDSRSIGQDDGTIDEHSNSSFSKMVRSKAKPSGSSGQNSDNQDASDKDIDGLTNLNSLNKMHRRRDSTSTNNTDSRSSGKKNSRSEPTPIIGEDLLHAMSSSDASDNEHAGEEDLPPVKLLGLNGDSITHLAKDDLLEDSDSSASLDNVERTEETQNVEDSEEENVKLKRRKPNAISSDSDGGTSRLKTKNDEARMSDFEDSEEESSEPMKRSKRQKKSSESEASGDSSNDGGKKKRRRIKQLNDSDDVSGSDTENEGRNKHGRKNIRKVMGKNQLEEATKKAARQEKERIARIAERQKLYNNLDFDESGKPDEVVLEKVVLDFDPETKEPLIEVDRGLVKKLKPHQANGIKFMWDACFESVKRIKKDRGSGCILAHCMGLGKTLQVISLTHTLLTHSKLTGVNRVLVVCPLSTVLNWVNEFRMWLKHADSEFEVDVYELSRHKQNSERAFQLQQWVETGGVCVLGYEMFRNLSADNPKKFKKKMLRSFQESLVDPGPDLVVCDEGHLLKNEKTSLSQSMNRVKTQRRIVLTGTPLQNNLKEYYCMVQFVKPNLLGKYNEYLNRFVNPITNGQYTDSTEHDIRVMKRRSHVLHKMLDGAVQRRDYGVLAPFLPPKHEYVLFITLSDVQVKLYQYYLDNYSRRPLPGKSSGFLFPDFQSLQRIWTHPLVLKYNSERYEIMQQKKREREEEDSEGSLVDFIDDDSTPDETSTEESSDDSSDLSDDSRKKSKKKKSAKKGKGKDAKVGTRRGTRANPVEIGDDPEVAEVVEEVKNENPTEWWIKLVGDEELDDMRNSHKLVLLFDILRQCETIGDKLLVFSQSLYSLDLIEHFLGKVDEATQEGRIDEKLGGHVGSWSPGVDYFRLDGSTSCENRSIWCKNFNREDNPRARLFLISTRAGGLGINLVAANRVVIFDVSWNPSHDVQSIFRVYRFGQKKPCYIYRFLAMGTMEEKIYERQVTKQAISKRVIDEQQIDRHYAENDLAELYKFEARPDEPRPLPTLPKDRLFAEMLKEHEAQIYKYHEHDSLLENKEEETLSEEERKAAWEDFENEKNKPPPAPFPSPWPMHNGMVSGLIAQQQQQLAFAAMAAMLRKEMPNINDNQIRDMLPVIYNSNPGLMQKMSEIYKYTQPGMMNPGMMNPVMNPGSGAGAMGGTSGLQYEPPWQRQHQQQQQMRLQQLMQQQNQMGAKFYAGGLGSRDPVAMALQQQRAREIMMGAAAAGRPRGRPPLAPRAAPPTQDVVNLDSD